MNRFVNYHKNLLTDSKVDCFVDFFHHLVTTMSVFMHMYCYPLFVSGTKTRAVESIKYVIQVPILLLVRYSSKAT